MSKLTLNLGEYSKSHESKSTGTTAFTFESAMTQVEDIDLGQDMITEADRDLDQIELHLELWDRAVTNVNDAYDYAEKQLQKGGLKGASAQVFHNLYAAGADVLGDGIAKEVPALEAFDEEGAAELETRTSMEGAGETIKNAAETVWKMIMSLIDTVKRLAKQYFGTSERLKKTQEKMKELAGALKSQDVEMGEKKVSFSGIEHFVVGGDIEIDKFIKDLNTNSRDLDSALGSYADALSSVKGDKASMDDAKQKIEEAESDISDAVEKALQLKDKASDDEVKAAGIKRDSYAEIKTSPVLPGGKMFVVGIPASDSGLTISVNMITAEKPKDGEKEVDAKDISGAASLIKDSEDVLKEHDNVVKTMEGLQKQSKGLSDAIKKASKALSDSEDKQASKDLMKKIKDMKQLITLTYMPHKEAANVAVSHTKAQLAYAKACLKNMKKKK